MPKYKKKKSGYTTFFSSIGFYKKGTKSLGLFFFLVGAVFILTSFFGISITGYTVSHDLKNVTSIAGVLLEIIGISLLVVKIKEKKQKDYKNHYKNDLKVQV